jgi:hypothetical protein
VPFASNKLCERADPSSLIVSSIFPADIRDSEILCWSKVFRPRQRWQWTTNKCTEKWQSRKRILLLEKTGACEEQEVEIANETELNLIKVIGGLAQEHPHSEIVPGTIKTWWTAVLSFYASFWGVTDLEHAFQFLVRRWASALHERTTAEQDVRGQQSCSTSLKYCEES